MGGFQHGCLSLAYSSVRDKQPICIKSQIQGLLYRFHLFTTFVVGSLSCQVVKAFIILSSHFSGDKDLLVKELQDHVKETTAPYKYPRKVNIKLRSLLSEMLLNINSLQ